jgi:hemerythrin
MNNNKQQAVPSFTETSHFAWSDAFATGIPLIDDQHKILVNIINDIRQRLAGKYSRVTLTRILLELRGYTLYHFSIEEQLMEQHGFGAAHSDEQELHLRQHQDFSSWLDELEQNIKLNRAIPLEALFVYLRTWLVGHILNTDKQLASFLKADANGSAQFIPADDPATRQTPAP